MMMSYGRQHRTLLLMNQDRGKAYAEPSVERGHRFPQLTGAENCALRPNDTVVHSGDWT